MTVGIVGLGLIGGSLAKAYKKTDAHTVLGHDRDRAVVGIAEIAGAVDGELTEARIGECELLLIALYPDAAIAYLAEHAARIRKDALVIDCCGTKRSVCEAGFRLARAHGFTFVGGHPMAGTHHSGFAHSRADLFRWANMVIVPEDRGDIRLFERIKRALSPAGFGSASVTTADEHDKRIAFTSQLAHVVSNAYIKSPTARGHKGFSAGSYRDLTRVAWLNPDMWTALFLENRDHLIEEIDIIAAELSKYRAAMAAGDGEALRALLDEGRRIKEEVDGG
ncbi:MAG: prephenate dehydrogenase [Christensenellales bacterium]|jgi:prephenate dehydrogenase